MTRVRLIILLLALSIGAILAITIWESRSASQVAAASHNNISAPVHEVDIQPMKAIETNQAVAPPGAIPGVWTVEDDSRREALRNDSLARIAGLRSADARVRKHEIDKIAGELGSFGHFLDITPLPPAPMNLAPPMYRSDGSRYSSQGVVSGMPANTVNDPAQRSAYEEALVERSENRRKRAWLLKARVDHNMLYGQLEEALTALVSSGSITVAEKDAALTVAKRQLGVEP